MVALTLAMDGLLARSPGLCDPSGARGDSRYRHQCDHVARSDTALPPGLRFTDRRWDLARVPRAIMGLRFAIDLSDVRDSSASVQPLPPRLYRL